VIIPEGIQTYRRADLPEVRLLNTYAESAPTVPGKVVLLPRPGMVSRATLNGSAINGLFYRPGALSGALVALAGTELFSNGTSAGSVPATGYVQMAAADTSLLIAITTAMYRFDGAAVAAVAFPDGAGVTAVAFLGGYAIAARAGSRRLYFTLDTATWDGLDYLSAEQSTDPIVGFAIVIDQLWVLCASHTEIFFLSGDADAPLQRVQGRVFDKGALARDSIVNMDNTVFWVGNDRIVYRGDASPLRVSDHGIEERIAASDPAKIIAWSYSWRGHLFYILNLENETVAYDAATKQWHEVGSYGFPRWRGRIGVTVGTDVVAGDDVTGALWTLTEDQFLDDGQPIQREFTVLIDERAFIDSLMLDCSTGVTPLNATVESVIEMRTSRDQGETWTAWRQSGLGREGQRRKRVGFKRLGLVDQEDMVVHFRLTDPVSSRLSNVKVNEPLGGRSR